MKTYPARRCTVCGAPAVYGTSQCREHRNEYQRQWSADWRKLHPYQPKPKKDKRLKHTPSIGNHLDGFYTARELAELRHVSRQAVDYMAKCDGWRRLSIGGKRFYLDIDCRGWLAQYPPMRCVEILPGVTARVAEGVSAATIQALRDLAEIACQMILPEPPDSAYTGPTGISDSGSWDRHATETTPKPAHHSSEP
jgi:hypothetical protein